MSDNEITLTINRLIMKHNYIEMYLKEIQFKYDKYNTQFLKEYYEQNTYESQILPEKKSIIINDSSSEDSSKTQNEPLDELPSNFNEDDENDTDELKLLLNKIYRKLSLKTHPDKKSGNKELFLKISQAYKNKELLYLIKVADELKIELNIDYTPEIINYIEEKIKKVEDKINEMQHHVCWLWCNATDDVKKNFKLPK